MVTGHLAGMFDEPTNIDIDWTAPIQSLSLRRLSPSATTPSASG